MQSLMGKGVGERKSRKLKVKRQKKQQSVALLTFYF
jgi:hypothetical protein